MLKSYGIPVRLDDNFVDIRRDLDQIIPVVIASIIFIASLIVVEPVLGHTLTLAAHRVRSSAAVNFSYLEEGNEFHIYQIVIDRWVLAHLAYEWYPRVGATRLTRGQE